jgi:glycosyltransferase involved in cell wall biosynthesis
VHADLSVTNTSTFPSAAIAAKSKGLAHIWYLHEFVEEDHGLTWEFSQEKSYKLIEKLSAAVVVNSMAVMRKVERFINPEKLHLVYCATETALKEKPRLYASIPFKIVMAGSVSPGKNQLLALKALHLLDEKGILAHLTIIGHADEWYKNKLEQAILQLGLQDKVDFKSYSDTLQEEFDTADCYLLTSRHEAFGRVLVEAGRAGLPCIAPDSGGAPEVVTDGQNGLIFESGNVEDLARKIEEMASDASLYARLAENAATMANTRFNLKSHLSQFRHAMEAAFTSTQKTAVLK